MLRSSISVVLVTAVLSGGVHAAPQQAPPPETDASLLDQFVTIDGRTHPELIPEWLAWKSTFQTLAIVGTTSAFTRNLKLSESEASLLLTEARLERSRDEACLARQRRTLTQAADAMPEALQALLDDDRIACRWATLEARDRVLVELSPEARVSLESFLAERRASMKSSMPRDELGLFRRPQ